METFEKDPAMTRLGTRLALAALLLIPPALAAQEADVVRLVASDAASGDLFGCAFDLLAVESSRGFGGALLVGSLQDDDRGADSGSVYLYELTPDGWLERAKGVAEAGAAGDRLGYDVAIGRGAYLAGAPGADGGRGRVHMFLGANATGFLGEVDVVSHPDDQPGAGFGTSIAVSSFQSETVVVFAVGAPGTDGDRGAVYLMGQTEARLGSAAALRPPEDLRDPGDGLGWAIAWSGAFVVAGAPWADVPLTDAGAVHLFLGAEHLERLEAPDPRAFDAFGYSVAARGGLVAVGAPRSDLGGPGSGAVHVYRLLEGSTGSLLELEATLAGFPGEQLGTSVAFEGPGRLAAGGRNASARAGLVRRFVRSEGGWTSAGVFQPVGLRLGDELGIAVAAGGGLFAAGAYRDDTGGLDAGAVWVTEPEVPPVSEARADLAVTTLAVPTLTAGSLVVAFTVANRGDAPAVDVPLVFRDPAGALFAPSWTCTADPGSACSRAGASGLPTGTVSLAPDGTATVTVTASPAPGLYGPVQVAAGVAAPETDPTPGDDIRTTTLPLTGDLVSTLTVEPDDPRFECSGASLVPGCDVRATLTIANGGPVAAVAVPVAFAVRQGWRRAAWSCTAAGGSSCPATKADGLPSGSAVTVEPGGSVTFTITGRLAPGLTGSLPVTGGIELPAGLDPTPDDAVATVTAPLEPRVFLAFLPSPRPFVLPPGASGTLSLTFGNLGPSTVFDLAIEATPPASLTADSWSCTPGPGATCGTGGAGTISDVAGLAPGSAVVYVLDLTSPPNSGSTGQVTVGVGTSIEFTVSDNAVTFEEVVSALQTSATSVDPHTVPLRLVPLGGTP